MNNYNSGDLSAAAAATWRHHKRVTYINSIKLRGGRATSDELFLWFLVERKREVRYTVHWFLTWAQCLSFWMKQREATVVSPILNNIQSTKRYSKLQNERKFISNCWLSDFIISSARPSVLQRPEREADVRFSITRISGSSGELRAQLPDCLLLTLNVS